MLKKITSLLSMSKNYLKRRKLPYESLQPGDIFIDCGANVGQETLPALKQGAIVYAFEPHPEAFAELTRVVGQNKNAHLFNQGVWDHPDTLKLYLHQNHDQDAVTWSQGASFISAKENVDPSKFVEVKVIDLADFIKKLKKPVKILKIDVEGAEFEILTKLIKQEIYKQVEMMYVETHVAKMPHLKPQEDSVKKLIAKKNITNIFLDWI